MNPAQPNEEFEALLEYLQRTRGFDFGAYKRPSLLRRVTKRMQMIKVEKSSDYLDYLEVHPEEFAQLFNTILINVTAFFRDQPAWDFLAKEIIPKILKAKEPNEPIRIWSAGCASGEEPYTIAILLAEALGPNPFRDRVKIYATDVDEEALNHARHGSYSEKDLDPVPPKLREKYFESASNRYVFRNDLRSSIIFGRHDLIQNAPISRLDLLASRNTLMYFNAEVQSRILARFHFALNDPGYLFLGRAEMLLTHTNLFIPVELKCRIFSRVPKIQMRDRLLFLAQAGNTEAGNHLARQMRVRDEVFESAPMALFVVDANGNLSLANEELETTNEELQSTNEELATMNEELRQRTEELNQTNVFLHSILGALNAGVVVLDTKENIISWNYKAEDLWGLRAEEVQGRSLLSLDIGLPVEKVKAATRACLIGESEYKESTLDAINRKGKSIKCRVTCAPIVGANKERHGSILTMEEMEP